MSSADSQYVRGEMPVTGHNKTFAGFVKSSSFSAAFLTVTLLFPILTLCAHMPWLLALVITVIVGLVIAPVFKLGGAWYATLIGLAIFAGLLCLAITTLA